MNYEKKYKEAQKWIESIYSELSHEQQMEAEAFFPELKESEDEKIRKYLIERIISAYGENSSTPEGIKVKNIINWLEKQKRLYSDYEESELRRGLLWHLKELQNIEKSKGLPIKAKATYESWISWLEKQGEQKPTDKIEPKFKVGDTMRTLQEAADGYTDGMPVVVSIDNEYYHCTNELIAIKDQDDYEFPPMNVKQKPNDMVEPKFQNGQWIVWQNKCYKVNYNGCGYELIDQNGLSTSLEYGTVDASARLYDITKDAKDGDVLASELCDSIILFRGIKDNNVDFYCDYDFSKIDIPGDRFSINDGQHYGDVEDSKDFHPATKEQRDTLIKAMTDAGWEFDFEKKELKKISQRMVSAEAKEALYDKPAWSEEDEYRINRISDFIWKNRKGDTDEIYQQEQDVNWLKSLKNKVQPQPKHEWSEEDKKMIGRIRSIVEKYAFSQSAVDVNGDLCEKEYIDTDNWLKSLKDRVRPKQEWSEEDETKMRAALAFIKSEFPKKGNEEIMEDTIEWLKSLRPQQKHEWSEEDKKNLRRAIRTTKVVYPEAADWLKSIGNRITWKPSKGQLECLGYAIDKAEKDYSPLANNRVYLTLKSLKEQLKKLIE